jgi:hypothetical protein
LRSLLNCRDSGFVQSLLRMEAGREAIPDDIAALKEALAVERAKALEIAAELAVARAKLRKTAR